ncbi:hypothetical protein AMS68_003012 [Peltaster fructicola]|uniref:Uncharacterized protein n=1 Tax=Peltaster fructicola TaxID=286661 RepID=A0A6H0XS84_9PEZI|nr:hypothetical protein AMS68_003012 [Peltaster fructicola]
MDGLEDLVLDVDADDYAEAAAGDIPSVPRTYQSEEQFQAIKSTYVAKHDGGTSYIDLLKQIPELGDSTCSEKIRLDKKQQLLLGYAAGELYYAKRYPDLLQLCERLQSRCQLDTKLSASIGRWMLKCKDKLG